MRYDERDTIFSRLRLKPGSKEYTEYYSANSEKLELDNKIRAIGRKRMEAELKKKGLEEAPKKIEKKSLLDIGEEATDHEYAVYKLVEEIKRVAQERVEESERMPVAEKRRNLAPETGALLIKEFVRLNGLEEVGITRLQEEDLYTHRGFEKNGYRYGERVEMNYRYAIVFAAPIEKDYVNRAPSRELVMGAYLSYAKSSEVAARLAMYIKNMGFGAVTDSHHNYHTPISFLGEKAGLGEMGRCNAVISTKYGNRTKFAAVFTDMPLATDERVELGIKEFCEICGTCRSNCPKKAIAEDPSYNSEGVKYWEHDSEACMEMWSATGHSCGVCMSSCPFSQGVDPELSSVMKGNPEVMGEILKKHVERYGKRNYNKDLLKFMPGRKL